MSNPSTEDRSAVERTGTEELRRQLRVERERSLNATDRVLGAQAEAAQARAEVKELYHRLHVREAELAQARELLGETGSSGVSGVDLSVLARSARRVVGSRARAAADQMRRR